MKLLLIISLLLLPFASLQTYRYIFDEGKIINSTREREVSYDELESLDGRKSRLNKKTDPLKYFYQEKSVDTLKRSYFPFLKLQKGNVYETSIRWVPLPTN